MAMPVVCTPACFITQSPLFIIHFCLPTGTKFVITNLIYWINVRFCRKNVITWNISSSFLMRMTLYKVLKTKTHPWNFLHTKYATKNYNRDIENKISTKLTLSVSSVFTISINLTHDFYWEFSQKRVTSRNREICVRENISVKLLVGVNSWFPLCNVESLTWR